MTTCAQVPITCISFPRKRKQALPSSLLGKWSSIILDNLPAEIIILILELALSNNRPRHLALTSQLIRHFVNMIVYRTVVLDTLHTITLFHRTASCKRSLHLLAHVKSLVVTVKPEHFTSSAGQQLGQIIAHCPSLCEVAIASSCQIKISPSIFFPYFDGPSDLTIQSFDSLIGSEPLSSEDLLPAYFSNSLTHLRICEPSDRWQSPLSIVASLRNVPNLTHLQLARRVGSNKDNDAIFTEEVAHLLATRKKLKMVVISIFGGSTKMSSEALRKSNIWMMVSRLEALDPRIVVLKGELGKWKKEWKDVREFRCGVRLSDFWRMANQEVEKAKH